MTGKVDDKKNEENSEDLIVEEDQEITAQEAVRKIKKLKEKLAVCEKEKSEYLDGWQRARAEFINFRREQGAELKDYAHRVRTLTILEILPIFGYFEAAFKQESWQKAESSWRSGVEQIYKEFQSRLKGLGVTDFGQVGEHFDPSFHESAGTREVEKETEEGIIMEIVEKGYRLDGKVIAPARVIVGKKG